MGSDSRDKSRIDTLRENWNAFRKFVYNPSNHTVLGRNKSSWAKILVFYLFYYGFLACLFAISITIVLSSLDEYTPRFQTRLQTPALAIQPKIPSNVSQTSDIRFNMNDDGSYGVYVEVMDEFLSKYDLSNQEAPELYENCDVREPPKLQHYINDDIARACRFDKRVLGACGTSSYGFDRGEPCILVKLNRVINWFPIGYTDLSEAVGQPDSHAPPLAEFLGAYGRAYKPHLMYTFCYGATQVDKDNLDGGTITNTKYYPEDNGLPFAYYPYLGKKRQPGYLSPVVAVQFTGVTKNLDIKVNCKVYSKNIRDNKDMEEGYFSFMLNVAE